MACTTHGTIYVPIQKFGPNGGLLDKKYYASSGFIYSTDNGQTWHQSNWIIDDATSISPDNYDANGNSVSSESSIFHHKGKIYLAGKRDPADKTGKLSNRFVWSTADNGQTWQQEEEKFIPHNVVGCESSTLALNDDLYFVAYSTGENNKRNETYITSNTGKRFKLYDSDVWNGKESSGYTSMSADADNIYVLSEGVNDKTSQEEAAGAILLRRFDYAGKEYANLNARLLRSANDLRYIQDKLINAKESYVRGSFGEESQLGAEAILVADKVRLSVFHKSAEDVSDDVYRTVAYDEAVTSVIIAGNNIFTANSELLNDSLFGGYQYNAVDYVNSADDEMHSFVAGYALKLHTDLLDYQFKINGKISAHNFSRNKEEGLGKKAKFDSKVIAITNELSKNFEILGDKLQARPFVGLDSTYFAHDSFSEQKGNDFNDITVHHSNNWSHGLYVGAQLSGTYALNYGMSIDYSAKARYVRELSDIDNWTDSYTIFDEKFQFASPVDKSDQENTLDASASVILNVNDHVGLGLGALIDSANENIFFGQATIKF